MARKISQLTSATDVTANDLIQIVDVEDGVMAPSGTNKKATAQLFANELGKLTNVTSTGSTTARSLASRFADVVNVKDFGAVPDGVTNNYTAILNAINYAAIDGKTVYFPGPGVYNLSSVVTVPSNVKVNLASNTNVPRSNFIINGVFHRDGISPEVDSSYFGRCFHSKTKSSAIANANQFNYGIIDITDEVSIIPGVNGATGSKVNGISVTQNFGGPNSAGGRHAVIGRLLHGYGGPATLGPPSASTTDRNYVGTVGQILTNAWEGGTLGSTKGSFFGLNAYSGASGDSTYIYNLSSAEFNTDIATGDVNRVSYHSGIQIASLIGTRGTLVDAALSISNLGGSAFGWKNGILFGSQNGRHALDSDSTAIRIESPTNKIIDVIGSSDIIIDSAKFSISHGPVSNGNCVLSIGSKTVSGTSSIRWFTDGTINHVHQFIANSSQLSIQSPLTTTYLLVPSGNGLYDLGAASNRWKEIFAVNGTINTSDIRDKQQIRSLTDKEKAVAVKIKSLIKAFKWNDAVNDKKEKARIHFGVMAQEVKSAFESENLDANDYGIFCYDEWNSINGSVDENGNTTIPEIKSGNSFGIRYNELLAFIISAL